jgi:hypothetical protein
MQAMKIDRNAAGWTVSHEAASKYGKFKVATCRNE